MIPWQWIVAFGLGVVAGVLLSAVFHKLWDYFFEDI